MAEITTTADPALALPGGDFLRGVLGMPLLRQVVLLVALAGSVAAGVSAVMWMRTPDMRPITGSLGPGQASAVTAMLEQQGIAYQIDPSSGMILVANESLAKARMQLAGTQGLGSHQLGYELLDREQSFGVSQFMEAAQHRRSLEGELARSISSIDVVQKARVLLAVPKSTAFVRDRRKSTASVTLQLMPGQQLAKQQAKGIANLVAGAVPSLQVDDVTIVDQSGRLLSSQGEDADYERSTAQLDYIARVERSLVRKVDNILVPSLGTGSFTAEVTADLDFTRVEQTEELFNPDLAAVRSEASMREESKDTELEAVGVPGALTNTPVADAPEAEVAGQKPLRSREEMTKNYEVDRTISHTQHAVGVLRRLTVSVLVDDLQVADPETGELSPVAWPAEDLERLQALVENAVGFSAERGDQVSIVNRAFFNPEIEATVEVPFWAQSWFGGLLKQVLGGLALILLIVGMLRPLYRNLSQAGAIVKEQHSLALAQQAQLAQSLASLPPGTDPATIAGASPEEVAGLLPRGNSYSNKVDAVRGMIEEDPERVAQVVKNWVAVED